MFYVDDNRGAQKSEVMISIIVTIAMIMEFIDTTALYQFAANRGCFFN